MARRMFQAEDNKEEELGESVIEGDRRLYMSGVYRLDLLPRHTW